MPTEVNTTSVQQATVTYLRILVGLALVFLVGAALVAFIAMNKLDRVVVVVENVNAKVDRFAEAAAPIGKAAIEKGVKAIDAVDTEDLGKSATEGVKEIGRAAKQKAIDAIRPKRGGNTNGE
jgi:hypothetical protein